MRKERCSNPALWPFWQHRDNDPEVPQPMPLEETPRQWCTRTLNYIDEEHGPVQRWTIQGRDSRLEGWRAIATVPRPTSAPSLDDAIDNLHGAIEREALNAGKRYVRVLACTRGGKNQVSTKTWHLVGNDDEEDEDVTEGAHAHNAIVAQALHHNRILFKNAMNVQSATVQYLADQLRETRKENESLRERDTENFKLRQQMLDGQLDRDLKAKRSQTLTKAVDAAVSIVQWKMMGGALPQGEAERAVISGIRAFGESLTDEQRQAILGLLRPEQQYSFATLAQLADGEENGSPSPPTTTKSKRLPPSESSQSSVSPKAGEVSETDVSETDVPEVDPTALAELSRRLPPEQYEDAVALLRESQALLRDPVATLLSPRADPTTSEPSDGASTKPIARTELDSTSVDSS